MQIIHHNMTMLHKGIQIEAIEEEVKTLEVQASSAAFRDTMNGITYARKEDMREWNL